MSILDSIMLAQQPPIQRGPGIEGFVLGTVAAVSILLVSVGFFYVLLKLGRFLDALKEKV